MEWNGIVQAFWGLFIFFRSGFLQLYCRNIGDRRMILVADEKQASK
jgi:hypothetical protein